MAAADGLKYNTLCARDHITGTAYFIDTGADVSVFPISASERKTLTPTQPLSAANNTSIKTWGKWKLSMTLGGNKRFVHDFHLADVKRPILGADFFINHGYIIHLKGKRLLLRDNAVIQLKEANAPLTLAGFSFHVKDSSYSDLVLQFPDILTQRFDTTVNKQGIEHHIITDGPPTHDRARCLDAKKIGHSKARISTNGTNGHYLSL